MEQHSSPNLPCLHSQVSPGCLLSVPHAVEFTSKRRRKGPEMTNQEGKMQHEQQDLLQQLWLFSYTWWQDEVAGWLWGRKEREDGEGMEGELPNLPAQPVKRQGQFKDWLWWSLGIKMDNFSILQPGCGSKKPCTALGLVRQTLSAHIFGFPLILCKFVKWRAYPRLSEKYYCKSCL